MKKCLWCPREFDDKPHGGRPQRFCRNTCKNEYHAACRIAAERLVAEGWLTIGTLQRIAQEHRVRSEIPFSNPLEG